MEDPSPILQGDVIEFEVPVSYLPDTDGDLLGVGLNYPNGGLDVGPSLGMNFFLQQEAIGGLHATLFVPLLGDPVGRIEDVILPSLAGGTTRIQMRLEVGASIGGVALPQGYYRLCGAADCQDDLTPPYVKIPRLVNADTNGALVVNDQLRLSLQGRVPGFIGVPGDALTLGFETLRVLLEPGMPVLLASGILGLMGLRKLKA